MKDLTTGNIYKTFIWFAIPMALSGLLSQAYSIINTIIAGKLIGEAGLAAVGATAPLLDAISSLFWGFCVGFSVYVANLFGAKQYLKIKESIITMYVALFVATVTVGIIMLIFNNQIFNLLNIENTIRNDVFKYFSVYMTGFFFIIFGQVSVAMINAFGIGKFPLYMSVLSTVLTISGNIVSVAVFDLGVMGLALSTVLASVVITVMYIFEIKKIFKELGVHNEKIRLRFGVIKESFSYSGSAMMQQLIMYVAPLIISPFINAIGSSATAAYTVVTRIYNIIASVYQNSAKTLSNYAAQCMGAKKYSQVKKGVYVGFFQGLMFIAPFLLICVFGAKHTCMLFFTKGSSGEALNYDITFSVSFLPFIVFNVINNLFHSFFRGVNAPACLLFSTIIGSVSRVLTSIYFIKSGYGMNGAYMGWVASWIIEAVFVVYIYYSGRWKPIEMTNEI